MSELGAPVPRDRAPAVESRSRERLGQLLETSSRLGTTRALALITLCLAAVWVLTYATGGPPNPLVHLYYLPIVVAASRFEWRGGLIVGLAAGLLSAPFLPTDLTPATLPGSSSSWVARLIVFVAIGVLVSFLSGESRRSIGELVGDARDARELSRAIGAGQLVAHYQPMVDLATGRTIGFEALCRWEDPLRGVVSPAEFIPLAERTGAIVPLGALILTAATHQASQWTETGSDDLVIAVNVSAHQLCRADFVDVVATALAGAGLRPDHLCLEITETAIMHDLDTALVNLTTLHRRGVLIALDDFGTGNCSLAYLQDFPIDIIKIDLSFVSRIDSDPRAATLVAAVVQLATALGATTVAEGIERETQLSALRAMGCTQGQGYLLGRPQPGTADTWLRRGSAADGPAAPHTGSEASRLVHASRSASEAGDQVLALSHANAAVAAAHASSDVAGQICALQEIAELQSYSGKFDRVVAACESSLELTRALGDDAATCRVLTTQAYALVELGLCEEALRGLDTARVIADRLRDQTLQFWVRNRLGIVSRALGRYEDARVQLCDALRLAQNLTDETRFAALNNLADWGMAYIRDLRSAGEHDRSVDLLPVSLGYAKDALALARRLDDPYKVAISLSNYGVLRGLAGDFAAALEILTDARQQAADRGYRSLELSAQQYTAPILLARGESSAAIGVLEEVLAGWRDSDERSVERDCLLELSDAHAARGEHRAALAYHRAFYRREQTLRTERIDSRADLLAHRVELEVARSDAADAQARTQQLEHDVNQDSLTRLGNRRYLDSVLGQLFQTSPTHGRGLAVAMIDLDHFKDINDSFGHAVGDAVLRRVAEILRRHSRAGDLVARYGGEEFLVAFIDMDEPTAATLCERLRHAIAADDWPSIQTGLTVTASIGLAARAEVDTLELFLKRADEHLYAAKLHGRDQVWTQREAC